MDQVQLIGHLPTEIGSRVKSASMVATRAVMVVDTAGLDGKQRQELERTITDALIGLDGVDEVRVAMMADKPQRRMIAIGSGKGGVGKSTLTANLAVALAKLGLKVGVVDADIYGPSQPRLLAKEDEKPEAVDNKLMPLTSPHGVKVLSMGHLIGQGKALAWRGPMAGGALGQLVEADWGDCELLLLDLPPGTGDVQLSMLQKHKPDGAVLVSTPQDLALIDAARAGQLFDQGEIEIIGLVENMAGYVCPHCGEASDPFGSGGVETAAQRLELPFLGRIPLAMPIREASDAGKPPALSEGAEGKPFHAIASQIADWLARKESEGTLSA